MKLAIKKSAACVPAADGSMIALPGNFHFFLSELKDGNTVGDPAIWELLGHEIIEVEDEQGKRLLEESRKALLHMVELDLILQRKKPRPSPV